MLAQAIAMVEALIRRAETGQPLVVPMSDIEALRRVLKAAKTTLSGDAA